MRRGRWGCEIVIVIEAGVVLLWTSFPWGDCLVPCQFGECADHYRFLW